MEEEKKTKDVEIKTKSPMWVVILVAVLVIALGCEFVYVQNLKKSLKAQEEKTIPNEVTTTKAEETNKKEVKKLDDSKDLVYTYVNEKSKNEYSFEIPYVNIDSEYAQKINKEISSRYSDVDNLIYEAKNYGETINKISYKVYTNDDILSLVITESANIDTYYVYNIDIYSGEKVSNSEILQNKDISETEFLSKVEEECKSVINKEFKEGKGNNTINATLKKNKSMKIMMFLDEDGSINIIPVITELEAQYDEIEYIIDTNL